MTSRNLAKPNFPLAPDAYNKQYMDSLVQSFSVYLQQMQNAGEGRATKTVMTNVPTSTIDQEIGTVYNDNTILRIHTGGAPGVITLPELEVTTEFTSSGITNIDGTFNIAGTQMTASAAELNYNDITTLGKVQENKTVTAGTGKAIDFDSAPVTNIDINSGTVDNAAIGAETPSTGGFTTLSSSGLATLESLSVTNAAGAGSLSVTNAAGVGSLTVTNAAGVGSLAVTNGATFSGATQLLDGSSLSFETGSTWSLYGTSITQPGSISGLGTTAFTAATVPVFTDATTVAAYDFKDEDNMASDSATAFASQQSIKAYVLSQTQYDSRSGTVSPPSTGTGIKILQAVGTNHIIIEILSFTPSTVGGNLLVQLYASVISGPITSGYESYVAVSNATTSPARSVTNAFIVTDDLTTAGTYKGRIELRRGLSDSWTIMSTLVDVTNGNIHTAGGYLPTAADGSVIEILTASTQMTLSYQVKFIL